MHLHEFVDYAGLNQGFAELLSQILQRAITLRGRAYLAVPGGKTPIGLFKQLAKKELSWDKVTICPTDERWLPITDTNSNEFLIRKTLIQDNAANAEIVSLINDERNLNDAIRMANINLSALPTFDAVILGMGTDGHTASLFPCSPEIRQGFLEEEGNIIAVNPQTAPYQRLSLTWSRLTDTRYLFLLVTGEEKLAVVEKAAAVYEKNLPISAFFHKTTVPLHVMYAAL